MTDPGSPSGWSDLPSDAEDTFFFTPDEIEDYRREKRRRLIDDGRAARLRALRAEADSDSEPADPREEWGGSDEEARHLSFPLILWYHALTLARQPDESQRELMQRTAAHVLASPNPAQLELRILANHGADARFAFLRGRWARAWRLAKAKRHVELAEERERARAEEDAKKGAAGIGALAGYGDSDDDEESSEKDEKPSKSVERAEEMEGGPPEEKEGNGVSESEEVLKAARRASTLR